MWLLWCFSRESLPLRNPELRELQEEEEEERRSVCDHLPVWGQLEEGILGRGSLEGLIACRSRGQLVRTGGQNQGVKLSFRLYIRPRNLWLS